jgi:large conductance mechanosensitive channel
MAAAQSSLLGDFKNFILKGNVIDLAVALVLGVAFGKIVESFIKDIITPALLAPLMKGANIQDIEKYVVGDGIKIGVFLAALINFLVIAAVMFLIVRTYETAKKKMSRQEAMAAEAPADPIAVQQQLISSIDRLNTTVAQKI